MKNLKDFINAPVNSSSSKEFVLKQASFNISSAVLMSGAVSTQTKADKFSQEVTKLVSSDEVISELSQNVGTPLPNESEDEFVARAKQSFKKILMARLSK